jgi:DnaJ-class molecular chaperone
MTTTKIAALEPWALEVLADLEAQADRIRAGVACKPCQGAGRTVHGGASGVYYRTCGACDGRGVKNTTNTIGSTP